jgi:hypothetical protein
MIEILYGGLILLAWSFTLGGLLFGAARWQTRQRFPNPLSAWWLPIFLAFAVVPPGVVEGADHLCPDPNNQASMVPFEPYVFAVALPFLGFALFRLSYRFFD